jgi:hypothetical protein
MRACDESWRLTIPIGVIGVVQERNRTMSLDVYLKMPACPHCGHSSEGWSANITHNLTAMADEAGIYKEVWRPEEVGITKASQLIEPLRKGIGLMKADRARFELHNSPNGWGLYENFLPWLEEYLKACEDNPDAEVEVSR